MDYFELYQRNIGSFSKEDQNKLKKSSVFIAGVGGVGGVQAVTLARMGVGTIIIMDPGVFDEPDMNRQYGAMKNTLGINKAKVTGDLLKDIAPLSKVTVYEELLSKEQLHSLVAQCDLIIDAIDLADFKYKTLLAQCARETKKWILTSPIPDFGAILMTFSPDGMTFEEFTNCKAYPPMVKHKIEKYQQNIEDIDEIPFLSSKSSIASSAMLSASILTTEVALILTGRREIENRIIVPDVLYIDLLERDIKIFNPLKTPKKTK